MGQNYFDQNSKIQINIRLSTESQKNSNIPMRVMEESAQKCKNELYGLQQKVQLIRGKQAQITPHLIKLTEHSEFQN